MPIHTPPYAICQTLYAIRHMPTHLGNIPNVAKRKALSHMIPHLPDFLPHHYQHSFQLTSTSPSTSMHCGQFRCADPFRSRYHLTEVSSWDFTMLH
ncbi:hypothetical protein WUBG_07496 [Wuchereria bancrofti]|uniref:Uncharacterized protein n=1 Tax=Wuchereria bancrofti TaxID=6293 RepID=J9F2P3_WUCBA|nr:hypothetical protein WUBG_07496 [Wuchereria bancrofti]